MSGQNRRKIADYIRELGKADKYHLFTGKVDEVNETSLMMKVDLDDGIIVPNVRLRAIITDASKGWWVIPKVATKVTIGLLEGGTDFVLINASEIEKFFIKIGGKAFQMDTSGQVFNGGSNGGVPKAPSLVTKLNNLENKLNSLLTAYNAHVHNLVNVPTVCGAGAGTANGATTGTPTTVAGSLTPTIQSDIENPDLKQ